MEDLIKSLVGKQINVLCGPAVSFRGKALESENGLLKLQSEEDDEWYISIHKIVAICEVSESHSRPGFIG